MEPEKKHTIYRLGKHGRREQDLESAGIEPWDPNLAGGIENAQALEDIIGDGITDAEHGKTDINLSTARTIARAVANALGDAPALDRFAATGEGDRLLIEREYLDLFENPTTPDIVRTWVNWLASFVFWNEHPEHPRPIAFPAIAAEIPRFLVRDTINVPDSPIEFYRPASSPEEERTATLGRINYQIEEYGSRLRAYLTLADVDATSPTLIEDLEANYIGVYRDVTEIISTLTDFDEWESDLEEWASERGLRGMVALDVDEIEKMTRETWNIVELEGRCYVFSR